MRGVDISRIVRKTKVVIATTLAAAAIFGGVGIAGTHMGGSGGASAMPIIICHAVISGWSDYGGSGWYSCEDGWFYL